MVKAILPWWDNDNLYNTQHLFSLLDIIIKLCLCGVKYCCVLIMCCLRFSVKVCMCGVK